MKTKLFSVPGLSAVSLLAALFLTAGCGKNETAPESRQVAPGTAPAQQPAVVSAEKTSFAAVTSHLDPGGNVYVYFGTEQWLNNLSAGIAGWRDLLDNVPEAKPQDRANVERLFDVVTNLVKNSGIEDISGAGMSSIATGKGYYRTRFMLHHYKGKGSGLIWTAFGSSPHPLNGLDFLPTTTALATYSDLDLAAIMSELEKQISNSGLPNAADGIQKFRSDFSKRTGLDWDQFLHSFGGEFGLIITLDDSKKVSVPSGDGSNVEFPEPGIAIIAKVTDDTLFDRVDQLIQGNGAVVKTDRPGLKMRTMPLPIPVPITLRPTIARSGDYLIIASSDALVEKVLAVKAGKEQGLKAGEEFKRLSKDLPQQGNQFSFVSVRLGETIKKIQEQAITRAQDSKPVQAEFMRKWSDLVPPAYSMSVSANTDEGWLVAGNGNTDASKLVLLPAVAVPAVVAGLALPALAKSKTRAQTISCVNNLKQVDLAKKLWASDNQKTDVDVPTWQDLNPYLGASASKLKCPSGGTYKLNKVGAFPTCTIPGHALTKSGGD